MGTVFAHFQASNSNQSAISELSFINLILKVQITFRINKLILYQHDQNVKTLNLSVSIQYFR